MIRIKTAAMLLLALCVVATPLRAEETALVDDISFDLPEGWRIDEAGSAKSPRLRVLLVVCETAECKKNTLETCLFSLRGPQPVAGADDAALLAALYETPSSRYARLRSVLKSTSIDAEILKPLGLTRIGERTWHTIETDARHNYKSGLFAETYINGRLLRAVCKTCETGEVRHQAAREMLKSFRKSGTVSLLRL
jgi:hypothetical protein